MDNIISQVLSGIVGSLLAGVLGFVVAWILKQKRQFEKINNEFEKINNDMNTGFEQMKVHIDRINFEKDVLTYSFREFKDENNKITTKLDDMLDRIGHFRSYPH